MGREAAVIGPCSHVVRARLFWPSPPASLAREQTPPAPLGCCGCHASPAEDKGTPALRQRALTATREGTRGERGTKHVTAAHREIEGGRESGAESNWRRFDPTEVGIDRGPRFEPALPSGRTALADAEQ
ncbi:hypothetical protein HPB47_012574 [Ixodes persulcatus]|uniref:Uncharacterized protein n=1 Tax=Ixodes persulcatus TaxID=34615 RepID=A0AC60NTA5_IXOPE|nr:hypothetical protein HPB47_012574 [Ixodes persulcatus]